VTDDLVEPRNKVGCQCGGADGWGMSGDAEYFVCGRCRQPSRLVLEKKNVLNLMRYGPHHNELVETEQLVGDGKYSWIAEYAWTPEKITGSVSGREARVWVHKSTVSAP
jgi:hypothetical protein